MMPRKIIHKHQDAPSLNLLPLIDVLFIFLAYFLISLNLSVPNLSLKVNLPSLNNNQRSSTAMEALNIQLFPGAKLLIDNIDVSPDSALLRIKQFEGEGGVRLFVDRQVVFQEFISFYSLLSDPSVSSIPIRIMVSEDILPR